VAVAAPWERSVRRYVARTENAGERLAASLAAVASAWLWILGSFFGFTVAAMLGAMADVQMINMLRRGVGEVAIYVVRAAIMLLRVFRDRQTPYRVRAALVPGLLYWLLPYDVLGDESLVGLVDDVIVAVISGRAFVLLAPDGVIAKHAADLHSRQP